MTPAWVCFRHKPEDIARDAYAGLMDDGERVFRPTRCACDGNFEVIVSGARKGTGSSRETAPQCEKWSGIRLVIAHSFAPIHARNNINLGQLMGDYACSAPAGRRGDPPRGVHRRYDPITRAIIEAGGLFPFCAAYQGRERSRCRAASTTCRRAR
jgi:3-isopropylmalate/(R)-2-methylmalate dehydratase large subunit